MKARTSFTVRPHLPEGLRGLGDLANNLRWSWDRPTRQLFEWVDSEAWDATIHDPVRMLGEVDPARLTELAGDKAFMKQLGSATAELESYLGDPRWFQKRKGSPLRNVAYFSPEFGISEALPQYSGGLGILAGDHLKAASDLGVPIIGVGLFYRHGYFRQSLSVDGWQRERFPNLDPYAMALTECEDVRISVDLAGETLMAKIWRADVGRIRLYLLDADIEENSDFVRQVTDRLYGGDVEHRLRQEILLGIGGVRALEAVGEDVQVFHTNEGHAGFLGLERIRQFVTRDGLDYRQAIEAAKSGCLFTTHTPVPAGIDRFPRELIEKYFWSLAADCGITVDELMELGHRPDEDEGERFNMAVMGLRLAARSNGVSKLHGVVSRGMFSDLWHGVPQPEIPISSITNGVHGTTWVSAEVDELLQKSVAPDWSAATDEWDRVNDIAAKDIWEARRPGKNRLIEFVRGRVKASGEARGLSPSDLTWTDHVLDEDALTICFARRFATYKRATLLLSQPERLRSLILDADRPVQFVFAGKAHPADDQGKDLIRQIVEFSHDLGLRERFVFIDDYDIAVARQLYHGCDVWLNTPRRPMEACGTSGEKAALNGGLNCSILDGWWDEMFDGENGWAISSADDLSDLSRRDELEANSLFDLLETQMAPLFHDRDAKGLPQGWIDRIRANWRSLGPQVTAHRMVRDYVTELYEPIAERADRIVADDARGASELAAWKADVNARWHDVAIVEVDPEVTTAELGSSQTVTADVDLGQLTIDDVSVQLLHGAVGQHDELEGARIVEMTRMDHIGGSHHRFSADFVCGRAGRYGWTVRVLPAHEHLVSGIELGRVVWADA